ncbi:cytochrome P450 3A24-like [Paramacrobiotus metropolitanus]|uniref:cytochrome P450 3A24-like n=1 Tax=Paramacrobiotus metropolitanus TaxID=2943436 RepID=UPI002445A287|nr:cytochrome P450 3A24-like [Paramacrobiotus metropolitanus]
MALFWIAASLAGLVGYFVYDTYRKSRYWPEKGIPSLTPVPLLGSLLDAMRTGQSAFDFKWTKKLGRIFGYFDGPTPVIVTSDLEMLKNILVKDFSHFVNRRDFGVSGPVMELNLTEIKDQRWKDIRSVLLPAFTSGKLKQMNNLIKECCDDLLRKIDQFAVSGQEFSAKELYGRLTLDVIATTFFATKINSQEDPNSSFVKHAKKIFEFSFTDMSVFLAMLVPKLKPVMKFLGMQSFDKTATDFFVRNTEQIIRLRKESKQNRRDFLQLMLNSMKSDEAVTDTKPTQTATMVHNEVESDVASAAMALSGSQEKPLSHSNYKLSLEELVAQAIIFFLAGYETTATTLTFMTYCLATNPDIQERLQKEIRTVLAGKDTIEYDDLAEMTYLDQCVNETLRLFPPISRSERSCNAEWTYEGVTYEEGTIVAIPIFAIHRDPENWPEPEVYNPERFSKENRANIKPYSFMTFGQGPRNCIGMRFALYEIKMVMASILKNYRFVQSSKTQVPLVLKDEVGFMSTEKGVWVKVEKL